MISMLEAAFFSKGRLFGCYNPSRDIAADQLLVICPPLFDEYRRCYRALSDLAKGCAAEGTHVFRFDYFGTGDSWGLLEEATIQTWLDDVRDAIEEGIALSGASRVYLCGVRFGATLAAQIRHPTITEYVLWDILRSGAEYRNYIAQADADLRRTQLEIARDAHIVPKPVPYEMFHLTPVLREGIGALRVDLAALSKSTRVHQIVSQEAQAVDGAEYSGYPYAWPTFHSGQLSPKAVLEAIRRRLT
jgi:pimeloyl-ACP methyl ester carboxylesterase